MIASTQALAMVKQILVIDSELAPDPSDVHLSPYIDEIGESLHRAKTRFGWRSSTPNGRDFLPRVASKGFTATAFSFPGQEAERGLVVAQCKHPLDPP